MENTVSTWLEAQIQHVDTNAYGISHVLGVTPRTVYKWLDGTHIPGPLNCRSLARFFGVPEQQVLILAGHVSANPGPSHNPLPIYTVPDDPDLGVALRLFSALDKDERRRILAIMRILRDIQDE